MPQRKSEGPAGESVGRAACRVLLTANAEDKAAASRQAAADWRAGRLNHDDWPTPPDRPARPDRPVLLPPSEMPKRRRGGSKATRTALLHAVAHIELNAIDLAWDIVARFGAQMPRAFLDDWVAVGDDEARHFLLIQQRLAGLSSYYGAMPAHDGLWQTATATHDDLAARLAVVPMVLEARGLDVTPAMIARFEAVGDDESAAALKVIYEDEIGHVAAGVRWFDYLCARRGIAPEAYFRQLVAQHFHGRLKPPFNQDARLKAGMAASLYEPLAHAGAGPAQFD
ncbi:MAG: ferritin-like domain-containing protein [Sphingomonadales bacterium]|nr:ferritin-like domain-containing protein [Sphingomonadales bacterium]